MLVGSKLTRSVAVAAKVLFLVCAEVCCLVHELPIVCFYAAQRC